MIITNVQLSNWKNFQNVNVNLSYRAFLVGANASGKSNFLDALRFIRDIVKQAGGLQYAVEERGGVSKIRCLAARKRSDVAIKISISEDVKIEPKWIYYLSFKHTGGGIFKSEAVVVEERVWSRMDNRWITERSESKMEDIESRKFTHLEQITANKDFREIYNFFNDLQYLHVVPQLVRDSKSYILAKTKEDFFGRNLLDKIAITPPRTRKSQLKKINEVLKIAVPQLKELDYIKDEVGIPHLEAIYDHWRPKAGKQRENQFSDGTLRIIGFMWALLEGNETVLLEEPELYLHAEIVKQLPEFISKLQRKKRSIRQVIITTHSYDLLSNEGIGGDEVLVLKPSKDGTTISLAKDVKSVSNMLRHGFNIADSVIPEVAPKNIKYLGQLKLWD